MMKMMSNMKGNMLQEFTQEISISDDRMLHIIRQMGTKTVMIIGDLMLDHYIYGNVDRISPEAPVPVVDIQSETLKLGGAGNVTQNIVSLGATPILSSIIGNDAEGKSILQILSDSKVLIDGIRLGSKRTTVKARVVAHTQQVVRLDREDRSLISDAEREKLLRIVDDYPVDAIIISDYAKGIVSQELIKDIISITKGNIPICVDPKEKNFQYYQNVDLITPNVRELSLGMGMHIGSYEDLLQAAYEAKKRLKCKLLLVTRGEYGMSLFEQYGNVTNIPSVARHVYDVTGAGDTVIATFTLAMISGATSFEAAIIANTAAGIVVGEAGAATVSWEDLYRASTTSSSNMKVPRHCLAGCGDVVSSLAFGGSSTGLTSGYINTTEIWSKI